MHKNTNTSANIHFHPQQREPENPLPNSAASIITNKIKIINFFDRSMKCSQNIYPTNLNSSKTKETIHQYFKNIFDFYYNQHSRLYPLHISVIITLAFSSPQHQPIIHISIHIQKLTRVLSSKPPLPAAGL